MAVYILIVRVNIYYYVIYWRQITNNPELYIYHPLRSFPCMNRMKDMELINGPHSSSYPISHEFVNEILYGFPSSGVNLLKVAGCLVKRCG